MRITTKRRTEARMSFKDHFSGHADQYGAFRPSYPDELFAQLASLCPTNELAWDCATGNGQAAAGVAARFQTVVATDASRRQLEEAREIANGHYVVAAAERAPLPDRSVDLITVAQAIHWFALDRFYAEVRRVLRPGGVIACWCYPLHEVTPGVDVVIHRLYNDIVGEYWPPERKIVEEEYRTLPFPFEEVKLPAFAMSLRWDLERMLGYLGTWSSVQRYRKHRGRDPLELIRDDLAAAWGDPRQEHTIRWPLHLRVGRTSRAEGA
jgi:SAM-dependent methyltransferase